MERLNCSWCNFWCWCRKDTSRSGAQQDHARCILAWLVEFDNFLSTCIPSSCLTSVSRVSSFSFGICENFCEKSSTLLQYLRWVLEILGHLRFSYRTDSRKQSNCRAEVLKFTVRVLSGDRWQLDERGLWIEKSIEAFNISIFICVGIQVFWDLLWGYLSIFFYF